MSSNSCYGLYKFGRYVEAIICNDKSIGINSDYGIYEATKFSQSVYHNYGFAKRDVINVKILLYAIIINKFYNFTHGNTLVVMLGCL